MIFYRDMSQYVTSKSTARFSSARCTETEVVSCEILANAQRVDTARDAGSVSVVDARAQRNPTLSVAQIAARVGRASSAREVMSER